MPAFDGLDRAYDFEFFTSTTAFQNGQSFSEQGTLHQTSAMIEVVVRPDSLTTTGAQTIWETGGYSTTFNSIHSSSLLLSF